VAPVAARSRWAAAALGLPEESLVAAGGASGLTWACGASILRTGDAKTLRREVVATRVYGTDPLWSVFPTFDVAPQAEWSSGPKEQDLSHQAPEGATQLWLGGDGVTCEIAWLLIRDNAGRRWEVRPGIARRAKRIRWYSRPKEFQPPLWFSALMRRFLVTRSKVRLSDQ
jgi:hypothetical protein